MGLDMYLNETHYVGLDFEKEGFPRKLADVDFSAVSPRIDAEKVSEIEVQVGYWRKANAIHNWFVQELADGIDECQKIPVELDDLKRLLATVNKVLDNVKVEAGQVANGQHAGPDTGGQWITNWIDGDVITNPEVCERLLPSTSGFFFGGTDYDQFYLEDLKYTKELIEGIVSDCEKYDDKYPDFYYQASW